VGNSQRIDADAHVLADKIRAQGRALAAQCQLLPAYRSGQAERFVVGE